MSRPRTHASIVATIALAASLVAIVPGAGPALAQTDGPASGTRHTITVHSTGIVEGTPDVLELTLGVDTRGRSAGDALAENSKLTAGVLKVLKDAGVADKDVQTSNLSISPVYDDNGELIVAYAVSNHVTARLHDLDKAGRVVDAATKAAGDQIVVQGLSFSIDDNSDLVAQARTDAVKRAKAQAQQLADAAGVELGPLVSIIEESSPTPPVVVAERAAAPGSADAAPPIQAGSQTLTVDVTVVYAFS
jgi:uncharacterized protein YggE